MLATLHAHALSAPPIPQRVRRVSRHRETDRNVVRRAVPEGSVRAAHGEQVMKALREHPEFARGYGASKRTLLATLQALIERADYESMTSRPGWAALCATVGKSRRTIARALACLRKWGLLGIVASGRSAAYATVGPDGERANEAAVYVLCAPSPLRALPSPAVDENGTPPALGGSHLKNLKETPTRARLSSISGAATPPESTRGGASAAPAPRTAYRPELRWPAHRTAATKKQRLAAATQLRFDAFLLRPMSAKDVASAVRDFLLVGWTLADLRHALDFQPDGNPWPHSGVPVTRDAWRLRGWMKYRLAAWRTETGEPLRSRDQRMELEVAERRASARAATERALRRQAR